MKKKRRKKGPDDSMKKVKKVGRKRTRKPGQKPAKGPQGKQLDK